MLHLGKNVSPQFNWLENAELIPTNGDKIKFAVKIDDDVLPYRCKIGSGSYGKVYAFIGKHHSCAVKISKEAIDKGHLGNVQSTEVYHQAMKIADKIICTKLLLNGEVQIMELGHGTARAAALSLSTSFKEFEFFALDTFCKLYEHNLSMCDFKLDNIIYIGNAFRLIDIDSICSTSVNDVHVKEYDTATYPICRNLDLLTHQKIAIVQTLFAVAFSIQLFYLLCQRREDIATKLEQQCKHQNIRCGKVEFEFAASHPFKEFVESSDPGLVPGSVVMIISKLWSFQSLAEITHYQLRQLTCILLSL